MTMLFVKPSAGLLVRHPQKLKEHLPSDGAWLNDNSHLQRMILSGDVVVDTRKTQTPDEKVKTNTDGGKK